MKDTLFSNKSEQLSIKIGGMQCSFCVQSIEKAFTRMEGVSKISINLSHEEALVEYDSTRVGSTQLHDTLRSLGYIVRDPNKVRTFEEEQQELRHHRNELLTAGIITVIAFIIMVAIWTGNSLPWFRFIMLGLTLVMIFGVGRPILKMAINSLRRRILNQHVLMELGAFGGLIGGLIGFFVSDWPMADFMAAAILITTYHILSGYVSLLVRTKSSRAIMNLMNLQPQSARIIQDGVEIEIPIEEVQKGFLVRVKPGESIPVDGIISDGRSSVDQSLVTGESIPITKDVGDEVIGGSINQNGTLVVEVTKIGKESFLQQVAKSIQEARALKPGILQAVERVLKYFVPGVLIAAVFALFIWTVGAWIVVGEPNYERATFATLAVLVMGYPCALGMATPLAMIRGGGIAADKGILMRSGEAFQVFKDVSIVALDKTGTITMGKPQVVKIIPLDGFSEDRLVSIAAAAEQSSEHPLAQAIVEYANENDLLTKDIVVEEFRAISGYGVRANVNKQPIIVGSPRYLFNESEDSESIHVKNKMLVTENITEMENSGWTVIGVVENFKLLGLISIADKIKPDAIEAIQKMKDNNLEPILVTGDNKQTADFIASQVNITKVVAEVLPQEKAQVVRELQQNGKRVAMVGDGINDAPALMQADVGIAFNAGTDIAIESADVILVNDHLGGVVDAYQIGKQSYRKTKQNVIFAFAFNGIGVPLAITGLVHPVFAMIAMAASVSVVLLNSYAGKILDNRKGKQIENNNIINTDVLELEVHTVNYSIPTIHCQGCIEGLTESLEPLQGVISIDGDPIEKTLIIDFQGENIKLEKLKNIIESNGHKIEKEIIS